MITYVRDFLAQFEGISKLGDISIEFTGMSPTEFAVRSEPSEQVIKRYLNGDTIRRFTFALEGMCDALSDSDRAKNNKLYDALSLWVEEKTKQRKLPTMKNGDRPMAVQATGGAYLSRVEEDGDAGAYIMQLELVYYKKAR